MDDRFIRRILVVDDDGDFQGIIQQHLLRLGYPCELAGSAEESMRLLADGSFDLVISDIQMEGKSGLELMQEAMANLPNLEFIIMTGHQDEYMYSNIIEAGARDFLAKPFEFGKLKTLLERIERERRILEELRMANSSLAWESQVNASLAELSHALLKPFSLEGISDLVLERATSLTESPFGLAGHIDASGGYLVVPTFTQGIWDMCRMESKGVVFKELTGLLGWVLQERSPLLTNTPGADHRSGGVPEGHIPIERFLAVPAIVDDRLIGQVAVANSSRDYTQKDLELLERIACIFALAIERKQNEDELLETHRRLEELLTDRTVKLNKVDELFKRSLKSLDMVRVGFGE